MCTLRVRFSQSYERRGVFNYALKVEVSWAVGIPQKIFVYHQSPAGLSGNTFAEFDHIATPVDFQEIPEDAASETVPWYRTDKCTVWFRNVSDLELAKQLFVDDINALVRTFDVLTSENGFSRQTSVEFSENGVHSTDVPGEDTIQKEIDEMKKDISEKISKDAMSGVELETNTPEGIRAAVQAVGNILGANIVKAVVIALSTLAAWPAARGAGYSGEHFAQIDLDENPMVVTNVNFDGLATSDVVEAISNATVFAGITNALQDAAIESNRLDIASNSASISAMADVKRDKTDMAAYEVRDWTVHSDPHVFDDFGLVEMDWEWGGNVLHGWGRSENGATQFFIAYVGVEAAGYPAWLLYYNYPGVGENGIAVDGAQDADTLTASLGDGALTLTMTRNAEPVQQVGWLATRHDVDAEQVRAQEAEQSLSDMIEGKQDALTQTQLDNIDAVPDKADKTTPVVQTATLPDECFPITWHDFDSYSPNYYTANKDQCSITPTQGGYQLSAFGIVIGEFGKSPRGEWRENGTSISDLMFNGKQPITGGWPQLDFSPSTGGDVVRSTELAAGLEGKADSLSGIGTVGSLDTAMLPGEFLPITFTYGEKQHRQYSAGFYAWGSGDIELRAAGVGDTANIAMFDGSTGVFKNLGSGFTDVAFAGVAPVPGKWPFVRLPGQTYGGSVVRSAELAEEMSKKMPANATGADIPVDGTAGAQTISAALALKADKSDVDPLLFAQYYPDGSVKSAAEFTSGIKYDAPDTTNRTITVKPFRNIDGTAANDNSNLSGRVVIPPFVDASGNPYITDDRTRFRVVGMSNNSSSALIGTTNLTAIVAPNTVTNIGDRAFALCTALTSVSLPGATTIGDRAFYYCTALASVSLSDATTIGDHAFDHCTALASVSLPATTNIGDSAFYYCTTLSSVLLPNATTIGAYAFYYCTALASVSLPDATTIGDHAFDHCTALASVSLPDATTIGDYAFYYCTTLSSVLLPNATTIGAYAFYYCTLSSVSLPDATTIGNYAFYRCTTLSSISLPAATSIGGNAFFACSSLSSVSLPATTNIGDSAFGGCAALASVSLPSATTVGVTAFASCSALSSVSLPATTNIGDRAFYSCAALSSVSLPATTTIGDRAFASCAALSSVSLPATTNIGDGAFGFCTELTSADFGGTCRSSVPTLGEDAFVRVSTNCNIIVPYTQYDAWIAADGWKDLQQKFVRHAEKADKPATFTTGNLAKFDNNGNPVDAGKSLDDISQEIADAGFVTVISNACHSDRQSTPVIIWDWNNSGQRHYFTNRFPDYTFDAADADFLCMLGFGLPGLWNFNSTITDTYFVLNSATQGYATKFGRITIPVNVANANGRFRITISYCMSSNNGVNTRNCNFDVAMDGVTVAQVRDEHASMKTTSERIVFADVDGAPSHSLTLSADNTTNTCGVVISGVKVDFMAADFGTVAPSTDASAAGKAADAKATGEALAGKLDAESAFPAFSEASTYAVGYVVTHEGGLYICHTAVTTAGDWTGDTNWTATTLNNLLSEMTPLVVVDDEITTALASGQSIMGDDVNFAVHWANNVPMSWCYSYALNTDEYADGIILCGSGIDNFPYGVCLFASGADSDYTAELIRTVSIPVAGTYTIQATIAAGANAGFAPRDFDVLVDSGSTPVIRHARTFAADEVSTITLGTVALGAGEHTIRLRGYRGGGYHALLFAVRGLRIAKVGGYFALNNALSGEAMPSVPTQNELAEAVKKIFTALGGTIQ